MREGYSVQPEVKDILRERGGLVPVAEKETGVMHATIFDDGSRLYEMKAVNGLVIYLTPEGLHKKHALQAEQRHAILSGQGAGAAMNVKSRSVLSELGTTGIVEKKNIGVEIGGIHHADGYDRRNRTKRLHELLTMRALAADIQNKGNENLSDHLIVPEYYGFASWQSPIGEHMQALFMEKIDAPTVSSARRSGVMDAQAREELEKVLSQAETSGIQLGDTTLANIFFETRADGEHRFIIIDQ